MKDVYVYPAIFYDDPDGISIEFPDLPGCLPCAHSMEAVKNNVCNRKHKIDEMFIITNVK